MNNPGYEGNPEAAVGAMAGGGFGAAEGETAKELNENQARQLLETVQRQQLTSHEGRLPKSGAEAAESGAALPCGSACSAGAVCPSTLTPRGDRSQKKR